MNAIRRRLAITIPILLATCLVGVFGCGGSKPASPAKAQDSKAVPRVPPPPPRQSTPVTDEPEPEKPAAVVAAEPRRPVGPWMEFTVAGSAPITGKSFLRLILNAGSDNVLQLTSYDTPLHEEFPSLAFRALTPARSLSELVNKPIAAKLYIMVEANGNVLENLAEQPVEFVITEIAEQNVRGKFMGQLHDVDSGGNGPISGRFQAVVESLAK